MPLQQGPFLLQPDDAVAVVPGVYDFGADAAELGEKLKGINLGWDDLVPGIETLAADPLDDLYDIPITSLLQAVEAGSGAADLGSLDDANTAYPIADRQLTDALAFAPTSAYADPPIPFAPPASVLNLYAPTVDASAFNPSTATNVGTPAGTTRPDAELENLTRYGSQNFVVGDWYKLLVLAFEGNRVSVTATHNGQLIGTGDLGTIDYSGNFVLSYYMDAGMIGTWVYVVFLDDVVLKSFYFVVTA